MNSYAFSFCIAFAALVADPALAQLPDATEVPPGALAPEDVAFVEDANTSNIAQIAMGHAAQSQAATPGIQSLARRIVSSHVKADQALQLIAGVKHVALPRRTDADDHAELADLHARRPGGEFDSQYVRNVIDDHERMIAMYEEARNESEDPDIRRYADTMLPALQDNLDQALALVRQQPGVESDH